MTEPLVIQPYYVGRWNWIHRVLGLMPKDTPRPSVLRVVLDEPEPELPSAQQAAEWGWVV